MVLIPFFLSASSSLHVAAASVVSFGNDRDRFVETGNLPVFHLRLSESYFEGDVLLEDSLAFGVEHDPVERGGAFGSPAIFVGVINVGREAYRVERASGNGYVVYAEIEQLAVGGVNVEPDGDRFLVVVAVLHDHLQVEHAEFAGRIGDQRYVEIAYAAFLLGEKITVGKRFYRGRSETFLQFGRITFVQFQ